MPFFEGIEMDHPGFFHQGGNHPENRIPAIRRRDDCPVEFFMRPQAYIKRIPVNDAHILRNPVDRDIVRKPMTCVRVLFHGYDSGVTGCCRDCKRPNTTEGDKHQFIRLYLIGNPLSFKSQTAVKKNFSDVKPVQKTVFMMTGKRSGSCEDLIVRSPVLSLNFRNLVQDGADVFSVRYTPLLPAFYNHSVPGEGKGSRYPR